MWRMSWIASHPEGPSSIMSTVWPRAAAYGGRLWNYDSAKNSKRYSVSISNRLLFSSCFFVNLLELTPVWVVKLFNLFNDVTMTYQ
jgi:hypothetical protein